MTTKLYWHDSHLTRFTAQVVDSFVQDGHSVVALDQSAFYPGGGGQPPDIGTLNAARVLTVSLADTGHVLHHLAGSVPFQAGETVAGEVDWPHRLEIMQQHTGQHILSQAFWHLFGAETRGFRIFERVAEIDLTLDAPPAELTAAIAQAEELANAVVFEDRVIRLHTVTQEEAAHLPLRKESFITDCLRVIEIADFDWSPCGGTHAQRTGEVGLIAVRSWERAKRMTRVQFVCGVRALRDYRSAHQTAVDVARRFSVGRDEAPEAVTRLLEAHKQLERRARTLVALALQAEAQALLESTPTTHDRRLIWRIFDNRDFEEVKLLAQRLVASNGALVLLATRTPEMARLVFARSADLGVEVNTLLARVCEQLGGRGGGKPELAQGGGPRVAALEQALAAVVAELTV
ncbi:MAG TPA: DHHA1 domain-containing protein [Candidatus Tectomicrobia bacterium]|jgi:alanyl-tRNA synthetase